MAGFIASSARSPWKGYPPHRRRLPLDDRKIARFLRVFARIPAIDTGTGFSHLVARRSRKSLISKG
jgi:hypothetical protein